MMVPDSQPPKQQTATTAEKQTADPHPLIDGQVNETGRDRLTETNAACGERSIASVCAGRVNSAAGPAMHQSFHVPSQSSSGYENAQCHAGLPRTSGWWLGWLAVWRLSGWRGLPAGELTYSRRPRPWRPSRVGTPRESPQQSQRPERRGGRPARSDPTPLAPFVSFRIPYGSCAPSTLYTRSRLASRLASRRYQCVSTSVEMPMMLAAACCRCRCPAFRWCRAHKVRAPCVHWAHSPAATRCPRCYRANLCRRHAPGSQVPVLGRLSMVALGRLTGGATDEPPARAPSAIHTLPSSWA